MGEIKSAMCSLPFQYLIAKLYLCHSSCHLKIFALSLVFDPKIIFLKLCDQLLHQSASHKDKNEVFEYCTLALMPLSVGP